MTREEILEKIGRMKKEIREIRETTDNPSLSNCMREIEIQIHMAFSTLGEADSVCPAAEA